MQRASKEVREYAVRQAGVKTCHALVKCVRRSKYPRIKKRTQMDETYECFNVQAVEGPHDCEGCGHCIRDACESQSQKNAAHTRDIKA